MVKRKNQNADPNSPVEQAIEEATPTKKAKRSKDLASEIEQLLNSSDTSEKPARPTRGRSKKSDQETADSKPVGKPDKKTADKKPAAKKSSKAAEKKVTKATPDKKSSAKATKPKEKKSSEPATSKATKKGKSSKAKPVEESIEDEEENELSLSEESEPEKIEEEKSEEEKSEEEKSEDIEAVFDESKEDEPAADDLEEKESAESAESPELNQSSPTEKFDFGKFIEGEDKAELGKEASGSEEEPAEEKEAVEEEETVEKPVEVEKPKRGRKKKEPVVEEAEEAEEEEAAEEPAEKPKRGRKKKEPAAAVEEAEEEPVEKPKRGRKKKEPAAEKVEAAEEEEDTGEPAERPKRGRKKKETVEKEDQSPKKAPKAAAKKSAASKKPAATKKTKAAAAAAAEEEKPAKQKKVTPTVTPKRGRSKKTAAVEPEEKSDNEESEPEQEAKASKKPAAKKATAAKKTKASKTKKAEEPVEEDEEIETLRSESAELELNYQQDGQIQIKEKMSPQHKSFKAPIKIISFNVNGVRAAAKKPEVLDFLKEEDPPIFCLQELKCSEAEMPEEFKEFEEDYYIYWTSSTTKKGYSGVATFSKIKPKSVTYGIGSEEHDCEGRAITCEYDDFFLVNVYVTNAGAKLVNLDKKRDWNEAFKAYLQKLDKKKPVISCGDFNCAHQEIDLANPKSNHKTAGFTPEEREDFTDLLSSGFFDSYRHLYPDATGAYTFWSARTAARGRNVGWRLDYFILSDRAKKLLVDNIINDEVLGSDHCPITLLINFDLLKKSR